MAKDCSVLLIRLLNVNAVKEERRRRMQQGMRMGAGKPDAVNNARNDVYHKFNSRVLPCADHLENQVACGLWLVEESCVFLS